ncbi:uncharacterized protein [Amphiura filiformis]|uniref:uncharacterized protein n=1 Tax=Amphiura filiformis TaxID=82378 RepID=UPI003B20E23C
MAFQLRLNLRSSSRLKRFDTAAASSCNGATQQTTINTGASTSATTKPKNWYQRLKQNDPEEFKRFQKFDAMKSSLNRTNMTNEKKKHYNEMTAKRMRKMRKRKAEEKARAIASGDVQPKQKTKKKRSTCTRQQKLQLEANKEKDRLRKKAKWGAKTQLEKDEINRKRREKRHQDKINRELDRMELLALRQQRQDIEAERERQEEERKRVEDERKRLELVTITQEIAQKTKKAADRKSFSRAWKGFPKKNSISFGRTFKSVYKRAMSSPTKRAQLEENGLAPAHREVDAVVMKSIEDQLALIKNSKKKIDVEKKREIVSKMSLLKKYRLQRSASRQLGIAPKTIRNANRPKHIRKRSTPVATVDAVIAHYISSAIQLPDQKYISKKTLLKPGFLQEPISHIYSSFRTKHRI